MSDILINSTKPDNRTVITVYTGSPAAPGDTINLQDATIARVWESGEFAVFNATGNVLLFLRPGYYWSFIWQ